MAIEKINKYGRLYGITLDSENKTIDVEVGGVSYDLDLQFVCDAIEFLDTKGKGYNSMSIGTFGITINAGESPVDVYRRIQQMHRWYFEEMPRDIAAGQKQFEERRKANKKDDSQLGQEPGERE